MKKLILTVLTVLMSGAVCLADEGMWLLPLLEKMNSKAMSDLGCRLSPDDIYSINHSSLKDAVVHFGGGCTGEIISKEGLLVTNHHCGYSYIQKLSSTGHNYLENGFWATNRSEEIPCPGLSVKFMKSMTDVTTILEGLEGDALQEKIAEIEKAADEDNPHCRSTVTSFYNDNVYYLIVYKTYSDVRFVGAPPASAGKFGGDTDNWMWPRHTCDFSMFRVYAGPDNEPAEYSPENVALKPERSLRISLKGVSEGDFAMIIGYPASTQRFQTARQLESMLEMQGVSIDARTIRQDIMWKAMRADEKTGLQYASKYASSSNGWKKWIGERQSFEKLDIIGREKEKEAAFTGWVNRNRKRAEKYGWALPAIDSLTEHNLPARIRAFTLAETLLNSELLVNALVFFYRSNSSGSPADIMEDIKVSLKGKFDNYNEALDKDITEALVKHYLATTKEDERVSFNGVNLKEEDVHGWVEDLFSRSVFSSYEKLDAVKNYTDILTDPAITMVTSILRNEEDINRGYADRALMEKAEKAYTAGLMEWNGNRPSYPDANSTMRLTYGNVRSYSPKDGVVYREYTTLKGVIEKEDPDNYEFRVDQRLKDVWNRKYFGRYADADGNIRTCFLTNCDITGGNSGSPVLDADGNLIGLAFDGNWESMSSDVMFEPQLQRCICVDIRYVLFMMDKVGGAGYLVKEMNIVR